MKPHPDVHRRRHKHAFVGGQQQGRRKIVSQAARHSGEKICGGRRDDDQIGGTGEFDMADQRLVGQAEQVVADRLAAQRRGRKRA